MKKLMILMGAVLLICCITATAGAYSVSYEDGTTYNTDALAGFSTYGDDLDGMTVIATYVDGSSETLTWATTGTNSGGVSSSSLSLSVTGDTFSASWYLTVADSFSLKSLYIDAGTGDGVFDVVAYPDFLSPGSADGWPFSTGYTGILGVTYQDLVAVNGTVYEDLYRTMSLDFGDNGFLGTLTFRADMDSLKISGDIKPIDPVPEPATMLLLGTGLAAVAGFRKKAFKK